MASFYLNRSALAGHVGRRLLGLASVDACLQACISEANFQCRSALFSADNGNCALKTADPDTAQSTQLKRHGDPDLFYVINRCPWPLPPPPLEPSLEENRFPVHRDVSVEARPAATAALSDLDEAGQHFETWSEWTPCASLNHRFLSLRLRSSLFLP